MSTVIGGSITLFSGFERPNNIEKAKLNLQSALLETGVARPNCTNVSISTSDGQMPTKFAQ